MTAFPLAESFEDSVAVIVMADTEAGTHGPMDCISAV
jgi:hypothetical protein